MSFQAKQNESDYYHSQSDLTSNMSELSLQNRSSINTASPSNRRTRPVSTMDDQWRKSSGNDGWKTSSSLLHTKKQETWKMSGKPRHAQLKQLVDDEPRSRRQSAAATMMSNNNSPWQPTKPLPQEPFNLVYHNNNKPPGPLHDNAPFHINTPMMAQQSPVFIQTEMHPPQTNYTLTDTMCNPPVMILPNTTSNNTIDYYNYQQPEYSNYINNSHAPPPPLITDQLSMYPPSQAPLPSTTALDSPPQTLINSPPKPSSQTKTDKNKKPEKKVRQITVQSINIEHRAWIDVLPSETGLSLAEKIHIIATFRTRKIVSITTASGRKVPLDNRPVFGSWMDMENFVDGERWTVEWRENDRSVVDRFLSKVVQAGGGKRRDHVVKEKD